MEYFDLYDKNGVSLHKTMLRGSSNLPGEYHKVVHIWIKNQEGKYLIQQRNKTIDKVPFMWAITSGAITTGEESLKGAIRETEEEIGLSLLPHQLQLIKQYIVDDPYANHMIDVYLVESNVLIKDLKLDINEVKQCAFQSLATIKKMIQNNIFWNYEDMLHVNDYFRTLEESEKL